MPSKIQLDENLWFLYICLQKSDMKAINFNSVAQATSLKPPAARMRFTRLRRQIESGTLNGIQSQPSLTNSNFPKRRIRRKHSEKEGWHNHEHAETILGKREKMTDPIERTKQEDGPISGDDGDSGQNSSIEADSEDEMPLAKLCKRKKMATSRPPPTPPAPSPLFDPFCFRHPHLLVQRRHQKKDLAPSTPERKGEDPPLLLPSMSMVMRQMSPHGSPTNQAPRLRHLDGLVQDESVPWGQLRKD